MRTEIQSGGKGDDWERESVGLGTDSSGLGRQLDWLCIPMMKTEGW